VQQSILLAQKLLERQRQMDLLKAQLQAEQAQRQELTSQVILLASG